MRPTRSRGNRDGTGWVRLADTSATEALIDDIAPGIWEFRVRAVTRLACGPTGGLPARDLWPVAAAGGADRRVDPVGGRSGCPGNGGCPGGSGCADRRAHRHPPLGRDRRDQLGHPSRWMRCRATHNRGRVAAVGQLSAARGRFLTGIAGPITVLDSDGAQAIPLCRPISCRPILFPGDHAGTVPDTGADRWPRPDCSMTPGAGGRLAGLGLCVRRRDQRDLHLAATADLGGVKTDGARALVTVEPSLHDLFDLREGLVDSWPDWDGTTGAQCDVDVQVRVTQDDPAGSPSWGDWRRHHRHRHRRPRCPGLRDPAHRRQYFTPRHRAARHSR